MNCRDISVSFKYLLLLFFVTINTNISTQKSIVNNPVIIKNTFENYFLALISDNNIDMELINNFQEKLPEFLSLAKNKIVTLIDFSKPSTEKRLWTINLETNEILINTYVAHGRNSGYNFAERFSNIPQSYQSSLGFYLTEQTYYGKHGYSLKLIGLENSINDKAYERAIVVHGADYVNESFIENNGRLGRSHGCPAIPIEITDYFINIVKEGSLLFIYHPNYLNKTQ